jgi:hypothetical protein
MTGEGVVQERNAIALRVQGRWVGGSTGIPLVASPHPDLPPQAGEGDALASLGPGS